MSETLTIISIVLSGITAIGLAVLKKNHLKSKCCGCDIELSQDDIKKIEAELQNSIELLKNDKKKLNPELIRAVLASPRV